MAKSKSRRRSQSDQKQPKTTRPPAEERRPEVEQTAEEKIERRLDAVPDRVDVRDWLYRPHLAAMPDVLINCDHVPQILDQGREGACTGFALAAVINFLLRRRNVARSVSCRMLYEMARRYDEWPGEDYEGSSARGAMKGWVAHGVCSQESWPHEQHGLDHFAPTLSREAQGTPGGAYFRVMHRQIRDVHAALVEVGIVYATLMVHKGWNNPGSLMRDLTYVENGNLRKRTFPVLQRQGRADGGHAIAIVGYTNEGFIIQNSWGEEWGSGGFALLPYEDYLLHVTDVWVAQLGVPLEMDLWASGEAADTTAGLQRATLAVPLSEIRPYVIDLGNNGELSRNGKYWTTERDIERLFAEEIPTRAKNWDRVRILLYLHGGLNDEEAVARRIIAFKDVLLENEIYPLHIMWESGVRESLRGMLADVLTDVDRRSGGAAEWLERFRDGLLEARDRTLELTLALPGSALWDEMNENAHLASHHAEKKGGMQLLAKHGRKAVRTLDEATRKRIELHVVAHSAGAIFAVHALDHLMQLEIPFVTWQILAPATRVDLFKRVVLPAVKRKKCPHPINYILSDAGERDDTVGPYGKSLLYLVSNAFEGRRETPLVGMERFVSIEGQAGADDADKELVEFFSQTVDEHPSLVVAGREPPDEAARSRSDSHGGFDNDPATLNSVMQRILKGQPKRPFRVRDLQF